MPIYGVMALAQILCAVHVVRTGRSWWWISIILFVPMIGIAVYVIAEVLPDVTGGRAGRQAAGGLAWMFNPGGVLRDAERQVAIAPTVQNRAALAAALLDAGRAEEATALYREVLQGIHATDPALLAGLSRALFALGDFPEVQRTIEDLRRTSPNERMPDVDLLYAQALERQGFDEAALSAYATLVGHYPGQEARCRYGMLLAKHGETAEAKRCFEEIRHSIDYGPRHQFREQREWYDLAKRQLAAL